MTNKPEIASTFEFLKYSYKRISIILNPREWKSKFIPFGRESWKHPKKIKYFRSVWAEIAELSTFFLLDNGDGTFIVIDGQHRFAALDYAMTIDLNSNLNGKSIRLKDVVIFKKEDVPENEIPDLIVRINHAINQNQNDLLEAHKHLPGFMQIIAKDNECVGFKTSKRKISVANLIHAVMGARKLIENKKIPHSFTINEKIAYMKNFTNGDCLEILSFLEWWKNVNEEILAFTNEKAKTSSLPIVMSLYYIWLKNRNNPGLNLVGRKLSKSKKIISICNETFWTKYKDTTIDFIEIINSKRIADLLIHDLM